MPKHTARLVLLTLAFAWAWLAPGLARAAFVPICDAPAVASSIPLPPEPVCAIVVTAIDDSTGETSVAPICDPRGASAIAPPRILPVSDARLEATPECGDDATATAVTSGHNESPSHATSFVIGEIGIPAVAQSIPRRDRLLLAELDDLHTEIGGPRSAMGRAVYHPPR
jgi:hypothetical protein